MKYRKLCDGEMFEARGRIWEKRGGVAKSFDDDGIYESFVQNEDIICIEDSKLVTRVQ